jgi:hypothetical protein
VHIISTDEDPGLWIESFAVINLRGVSTNKTIIYLIAMQTYKELKLINLGLSGPIDLTLSRLTFCCALSLVLCTQ